MSKLGSRKIEFHHGISAQSRRNFSTHLVRRIRCQSDDNIHAFPNGPRRTRATHVGALPAGADCIDRDDARRRSCCNQGSCMKGASRGRACFDAAAPGRLRHGRRRRHARAQTPEFVGQAAIICAVLASLPASAHDSARKPCASLRVAQIIAAILRAAPFSRSARSKSCHASCGPPPGGSKSVRCSASKDFRGGFALAEQVGPSSLTLAPAQLARGLERREKGIPLAARRRPPVLR